MLTILALTLATALASPVGADSPAAAATAPARFEVAERLRMNLGGDSGQYTNWARDDLARFDGFSTTVRIDDIHGKPGDKWAASARINLLGAGEGESRARVSLVFMVDRKTRQLSAAWSAGKDLPWKAFDVALSMQKPIEVKVVPDAPGKLHVEIGESIFTVDDDVDIKAIEVSGSGLDVSFVPFLLLRRVDAQ